MLRRRRPGASLDDIERAYRARLGAYRRVAAAICGDRDAAGDIVQEAFARAVRERRRFRGEAAVDTWLWRIVVNTARNQVRDRPLAEPLTEVAAPEAALSELGEAVGALSERQRLLVFLRYYADLDYASIGEIAGIAPGTVGATLNQARATLEEHLGRVEARL